MKKSLKCFAVLFMVAVLFATPFTTYAATWQCTADYSSGDFTYKEFAFSPPQPISIGERIGLPNNANQGGFFVKAGQQIVVSVRFSTMCRSEFSLVNQNTGEIVHSIDNYISNAGQLAPIISQTGYYVPLIKQTDSQIPALPEFNYPSGVESYIVVVQNR